MKHGVIPTKQQGWFGQTIQKNVPFQHPLQKVNGLLYATLEVPKVLSPILSCYVENNFLNHMLIIMTTWMGMFLKTGLKTLYWKTYRKAERFWEWWITLSITVKFLKRRQQWIWKKRYYFIYDKTSYWKTRVVRENPWS